MQHLISLNMLQRVVIPKSSWESLLIVIQFLRNITRKVFVKVIWNFSYFLELSIIEQRHIIMKAFIFSKLNYYLLLWMYHNRILNNIINHFHKRTQYYIIYRDKKSIIKELIEINSSITIHGRNLPYLMTKTFNVKKGVSPSIINSFWICRKSLL